MQPLLENYHALNRGSGDLGAMRNIRQGQVQARDGLS
jgi:hypothetical protein